MVNAMSTKPPDLGKGSFFYRKSAVEQVLQDRDLMLRYLQQRTRDAEGRVAGLEAQLTAATNDGARRDKELARVEGELAGAAARLGPTRITAIFTTISLLNSSTPMARACSASAVR